MQVNYFSERTPIEPVVEHGKEKINENTMAVSALEPCTQNKTPSMISNIEVKERNMTQLQHSSNLTRSSSELVNTVSNNRPFIIQNDLNDHNAQIVKSNPASPINELPSNSAISSTELLSKAEENRKSVKLKPDKLLQQQSQLPETQAKLPLTSQNSRTICSPNKFVIEDITEEATFDPKGKSISTGRTATGWL